jgi:hypothetical protein
VASKNYRELSRQQRFFTTWLCFGLSISVFNANARPPFQAPPTLAARRTRRACCFGQTRHVEHNAAGVHWHALCFFVICILLV